MSNRIKVHPADEMLVTQEVAEKISSKMEEIRTLVNDELMSYQKIAARLMAMSEDVSRLYLFGK